MLVFIIAWAFYGLFLLRDFLTLLMLSVTISILMDAPISHLSKKKVLRPIVTFFLYLIVFSLFFGSFALFLPIIVKEVGKISNLYPDLFHSFQFIKHFSSFENAKNFLFTFDKNSLQSFFEIFVSMFGGLTNFIIVIIIAFYLNMKQHAIEQMIEYVTPGKYESFIISHWTSFRKKVESWFHGQLLLSFLVFLFTLLGLSILRIPYAFLLSLLAGIFGLIPYGILFAVIPALILSFNAGGIKMLVIVSLLYAFTQQLVDYIIQPFISKRMTGIPPVAVIISAIASTKLFGIVGLILAIPIALFVMELFSAWEERDKSLKKYTSK